MTDEIKEELTVILDLLKKSLIKNGISMYLNQKDETIGFFDIDTYLFTHKISGFRVNINDLVK